MSTSLFFQQVYLLVCQFINLTLISNLTIIYLLFEFIFSLLIENIILYSNLFLNIHLFFAIFFGLLDFIIIILLIFIYQIIVLAVILQPTFRIFIESLFVFIFVVKFVVVSFWFLINRFIPSPHPTSLQSLKIYLIGLSRWLILVSFYLPLLPLINHLPPFLHHLHFNYILHFKTLLLLKLYLLHHA